MSAQGNIQLQRLCEISDDLSCSTGKLLALGMDQLRDCVFGGCQDIDTASPRVKNEHLKMYFSVAHFVLMAYLMEKKDPARKNLDTL